MPLNGHATPLGAIVLVALGGCTEYQRLSRGDREDRPSDSDAFAEVCDGLDNDADGVADDGFPDLDADGIADCLQCALGARPDAYVGHETACDASLAVPDEPWSVEVAWRVAWEGGCRLGPVVDLDEDGASEVLCAGWTGVRAYSGTDGALLWESTAFDAYTPLAAADLDRDGTIDLVGIAPDGT